MADSNPPSTTALTGSSMKFALKSPSNMYGVSKPVGFVDSHFRIALAPRVRWWFHDAAPFFLSSSAPFPPGRFDFRWFATTVTIFCVLFSTRVAAIGDRLEPGPLNSAPTVDWDTNGAIAPTWSSNLAAPPNLNFLLSKITSVRIASDPPDALPSRLAATYCRAGNMAFNSLTNRSTASTVFSNSMTPNTSTSKSFIPSIIFSF
mmetsp:Transcript_19143/g.32782  ORF Transcript_19143/g.32782 Transcript_19143/m.32782 type:complete len:204 (-) Transcript_19143:996-1607(-)